MVATRTNGRRVQCARSARVLITAVVALLSVVTATTGPGQAADSVARPLHPFPRIVVSSTDVMVDEPVRIAIVGLQPGQLAQLHLQMERADGLRESAAWFAADRRGRVDVERDAPVHGDYEGVDPMGLFWSAHLTSGAPRPGFDRWIDRVELTARASDGRDLAHVALIRHYLDPRVRVTPVRDRGLVGTMFEPPVHGRRPTLLVVGGSEGGITSAENGAAGFASHGFNALALAYFDPAGSLGGLPRALSLIPLEYFATAIEWLGQQPSVDADRIGISGGSRGAELALLLASRYPELRAVVAYAPSSVVWSGIPPAGSVNEVFMSAWTEGGEPIPFLLPRLDALPDGFEAYRRALSDPVAASHAAIPVERINGPVLLISGTDDRLWPAPEMGDAVIRRLRAHGHPYADQHLSYEGAGHVILRPFQPTTDRATIPELGIPLGGNPVDAAHADRDHWPRLLQFLTRTLGRARTHAAG